MVHHWNPTKCPVLSTRRRIDRAFRRRDISRNAYYIGTGVDEDLGQKKTNKAKYQKVHEKKETMTQWGSSR